MKSTQSEARAAGDIYYNTGKACTHGHYSARYTVSGNCIDCKVRRAAHAPKKARNDLIGFSALFTPEWHAAFTTAWQTVSMGNDADRARLMAAMNHGNTLTRPDALAAGITVDGEGCIGGHDDYRDGGDEMHIKVGAKWYSETALVALIHGQVHSIKEL